MNCLKKMDGLVAVARQLVSLFSQWQRGLEPYRDVFKQPLHRAKPRLHLCRRPHYVLQHACQLDNTPTVCKITCLHKNKTNFHLFAVQIYPYGVGQGQAFQSRTDDSIVAEHYEQCHQQGHDRSHEVQPEGEPTCPRVKQ